MKWILTIFLVVPFVFTFLLYIVLRKLNVRKNKALSYAADLTTPWLIISLPIMFKAIWGKSFIVILFSLLIIIAIIFTYIEWRTKKEIHYLPVLKKIWRFYFLILTLLYIVFLVVGLIYWIVQYMSW